MAKVSKVTNDEERAAMQSRIIQAAIHLEDPLLDEAERARLMPAYDEMVRQMKAYDRAELCRVYPGLREIYAKLGWVVGEGKVDNAETTGTITPIDRTPVPESTLTEQPKQPESKKDPEPEPPKQSGLADFLD